MKIIFSFLTKELLLQQYKRGNRLNPVGLQAAGTKTGSEGTTQINTTPAPAKRPRPSDLQNDGDDGNSIAPATKKEIRSNRLTSNSIEP